MSSTDTTSDKRSGVTRFRLMHLMLFIAAVGVVAACLRTPLNNLGHARWTRASPFTDVEVDGDAALVEFLERRANG